MRRFRREATTVARLSRPNVVAVYEFGAEAVPYIAMELAMLGKNKFATALRPSFGPSTSIRAEGFGLKADEARELARALVGVTEEVGKGARNHG